MMFTPQTRLADYVKDSYARTVGPQYLTGTNRAVSLLAWVLMRPPVVADITSENLDKLATTIAVVEPDATAEATADTLKRLVAVWRHAIVAGVLPAVEDERLWTWGNVAKERLAAARNGRPRPGREPLSKDAGTLWGYCLSDYFKKNVTIRSGQTQRQYAFAIADLRDAVGHEPTLADLTDDNVGLMMKLLQERNLAPRTINERRGRIACLWEWLAKRRLVDTFPIVQKVNEPKRIPTAWTKEEVRKVFEACWEAHGNDIGGVKPRYWWTALHHVLWDSGARIGEVLAMRWEWLDGTTGLIRVPAEVRKGQERDMLYRLSPDCLAILAAIREPTRDLLFPWPFEERYLWFSYKRILRRAGLPCGRRDMFHRMRRSVASHVQAAGFDASTMLAHSSSDLTRKSYLDPSIVSTTRPSDVLFRPPTTDKPLPPPV